MFSIEARLRTNPASSSFKYFSLVHCFHQKSYRTIFYCFSLHLVKVFFLCMCFFSPLQIALAKACGNGNQLGLEAKSSSEMVAQMFQASRPISKQNIFTVQKKINETMR